MAALPRIACLAARRGHQPPGTDRPPARLHVEIAGVGSDKASARALDRAAAAGLATRVFPLADYADRDARDAAIAAGCTTTSPPRSSSSPATWPSSPPFFIGAFRNRIVNVHPSLLPQFPGLRAIEQALDAGAPETGVTVHLVDEGVDTGPVLLQQTIPLTPGDTPAGVRAALAPVEHDLLCRAVTDLVAAHTTKPQTG